MSPRAALALQRAARARAVLEGRDFVAPDDVKAMAPSVISHRLELRPAAGSGSQPGEGRAGRGARSGARARSTHWAPIANTMLTARGRRTITLGLVAGAAGRILGIPGALRAGDRCRGRGVGGTRPGPHDQRRPSRSPHVHTACRERGRTGVCSSSRSRTPASPGSLSTPITLVSDDSPGLGPPPAGEDHRAATRPWRPGASELRARHESARCPSMRGPTKPSISDPSAWPDGVCRSAGLLDVSCFPTSSRYRRSCPNGAPLGPRARLSVAERLTASELDAPTLRARRRPSPRSLAHDGAFGELMVRDGEDRDEPGRIATTVLLDVGDGATPPEELDRAVEVAASVLFAAADESSNEVSGTYRLLTTADLDTGSQRGHDGLLSVLVALADCAAPRHGRRRGSRPLSNGSAGPTATRCWSSSALSGPAHQIPRFSRISLGPFRLSCSSSSVRRSRPSRREPDSGRGRRRSA